MNLSFYLKKVLFSDNFLAYPLVFWPLTKPFISGFSLGSSMLMKIWKCNLWSAPCGNHNPIMKSYQRKSSSCRERKGQSEREGKLVIKPAQREKTWSKELSYSEKEKSNSVHGLVGWYRLEDVSSKGHLCLRYQFESLQPSDSFFKRLQKVLLP